MSHLEYARPGSTPIYYHNNAAATSKGTQVVTTLVLLVLGYYVLSFFDVWPSTSKRVLYEYTIRAIPSHFIHALQTLMIRTGRVSSADAASFSREKYGDFRSKEEALQRIVGQTAIPQVFKKARTLSGFDKFILPAADAGPPGLGNWDNSCYQNSVLQGLASLPAFHHYIRRSLLLCEKADVDRSTTEALVSFLQRLADSDQPKCTIWTPGVLKSMNSWIQQDAQEYFSKILDAVEKETVAYAKRFVRRLSPGYAILPVENSVQKMQDTKQSSKAVKSFLNTVVPNPVAGMESSALECQTCGYSEGINLTQFECLTLSLGVGGPCDLEYLLDAYTDAELLEGVECDRCTKAANGQGRSDELQERKQEANGPVQQPKSKPKPKPVLRTKAKQTTLARLPKDLIFHINRSIFDEYGNQRKNTSFVRFPQKLDLRSRWCAPIDDEDDESTDTTQAVYELLAIVTHSGRHDDGHYVAYGRRDKDWFCFNDEIVTKMTEDEVLRRGNVFMLFYEKIDFNVNGDDLHNDDDDTLSEKDEEYEESSRDAGVLISEEKGTSELKSELGPDSNPDVPISSIETPTSESLRTATAISMSGLSSESGPGSGLESEKSYEPPALPIADTTAATIPAMRTASTNPSTSPPSPPSSNPAASSHAHGAVTAIQPSN